MTPSHHPREETLLSLAAGALSAGPALVIEAHLAGCPLCRERVRACEAVGGALLRETPPAPLGPELLARTFQRLDAPPLAKPDRRRRPTPPELAGAPAPLRRCEIGPWRFLQPGLRISRVRIPGAPQARAILLKFAPGHAAPQHGHEGVEYTQVLTGAFSDALGRYAVGDCIEADEELDHQPTVEGDTECICLAAVDGRLKLHSLVGRLLQPLLGL